jgi:protease-4
MRLALAVLRLVCLTFIAWPVFAFADSPATPTPTAVDQGITLPASSAATVEGSTSLLVNPASTGYIDGSELVYLHQRSVLADRTSDGVFAGTRIDVIGLGFGEEWVRQGGLLPSYHRTSLSLSLGSEFLAIGATYHWTGSSESFLYNNLNGLDVGLTARPFRFLSIGLAALDVDGPRVFGIKLPRRYDAGLALRPFGERFTLSGDLLTDDQQGWNGAALSYNANLRLFDGVNLVGGITHYFNQSTLAATLGIVLDTAHFGVGYAASTDNKFTGFDHTIGARLSTARRRDLKLGSRFVMLDLGEMLSSTSDGLSALLGSGADRYLTLLEVLRRAKEDEGVQGVVLKIGGATEDLGIAHTEELRAQVAALRSAGKMVLALLTDAGDSDYFLASSCDKIYALPEATLLINGFSSEELFLGDALAKIGVRVDVARVGAYKNAPDQFTRGSMSPEQHEAISAYLNTAFQSYVTAVSKERNLTPEKFKALLERGILTPQQAQEAGLLDGIHYPDELSDLIATLTGHHVGIVHDYADWDLQTERWGELPHIALVRVVGTISDGKSRESPFGAETQAGAETLVKGIEQASEDDAVKAIVVRVDSPGGSGSASNLIYRALEKARAKKPVVVSMGNTAASGGYYIAVSGDVIYAEPTTLTGSIGVFALKPDLSGLLKLLSVGSASVDTNANANLFSLSKGWDAQEQAAMQGYVDAFYDRFISLVGERRKLDKSAVDQIARGRIWSGTDAKTRNLVDKLGSLDDAIADAKQRAGLDPDARAEIEIFGAPKGVLPSSVANIRARIVGDEVHSDLKQLGLDGVSSNVARALTEVSTPGVLAITPFELRIR